ncbi:GEM-like protein 7 [Syzygium oleosum]|uniref:GEM-like protein 7 n=1 Tax=Syzygium oleosum TaxID=219896 RepID=UPI0011D1CA78|nr:GEM-like protein 7 [Syzygium oleosum]
MGHEQPECVYVVDANENVVLACKTDDSSTMDTNIWYLHIGCNKVKFVRDKINMLGKNADVIAHGFREHVRLSPGITVTVRGKLSFGARALQLGGIEKVFRELFSWEDGEKLMESFECYWSSSTSPIAVGLLFISTEKVAIWSERSVEVVSPGGGLTKIHYELKVPIRKIKAVNEAENVDRPAQKYINIVTMDDRDFWFTGFFNYQNALKHLRRVIHQE